MKASKRKKKARVSRMAVIAVLLSLAILVAGLTKVLTSVVAMLLLVCVGIGHSIVQGLTNHDEK